MIRDFRVMSSISSHQDDNSLDYRRRRPHTPVDPSIEMTESGHLDTVNDDIDMVKLVRTDSLFDYGAH